MVLTPLAILIFEKNRTVKNLGVLSSWHSLTDLDKIRRHLPYRSDFLTLILAPSETLVLHFLDGKADAFASAVASEMQQLGVPVQKVKKSLAKIKESDVTKEAIA